MVKPITPDEVKEKIINSIPNYVIDAFNMFIERHYLDSEYSFFIKLYEVQDHIVQLNIDTFEPDDQFYGIEQIYRDAGWAVERTNRYNTNGFEFTKK